MKKSRPIVVLFIFAVYLCTSYVQAQIGNFRGLPWGSSKEDVKKVEGERTISQSTSNQGLETLVYGGKADDLDCVFAFYFADKKLVRGRYIFSENHPDKNLYIDDFQTVKASLIEKYGKPKEDEMMWSDDLYKNDRTEWGKAIAGGHLAYHAEWILPDTVIMHQLRDMNSDLTHALQYESTMKEHRDFIRKYESIMRGHLLDLIKKAKENAKSNIW